MKSKRRRTSKSEAPPFVDVLGSQLPPGPFSLSPDSGAFLQDRQADSPASGTPSIFSDQAATSVVTMASGPSTGSKPPVVAGPTLVAITKA